MAKTTQGTSEPTTKLRVSAWLTREEIQALRDMRIEEGNSISHLIRRSVRAMLHQRQMREKAIEQFIRGENN